MLVESDVPRDERPSQREESKGAPLRYLISRTHEWSRPTKQRCWLKRPHRDIDFFTGEQTVVIRCTRQPAKKKVFVASLLFADLSSADPADM
jgi:hypothetical protein